MYSIMGADYWGAEVLEHPTIDFMGAENPMEIIIFIMLILYTNT